MAYETTPTEGFVDEIRGSIDRDDPHHRLYLPGRRWMTQRTLSRIAPTLLPTPQASDGDRGPDYARQRERKDSHGSGGDDLTTTVAKMLPTPTAGDAKSSGSRNLEGSRAHAGVSLTDAVRFGNSEPPRLLPTPTSRDGKGPNPNEREGGDDLPAAVRLLPTPVANPDNPGAGGELRAALTHGEGRRNETGTDTLGRPNTGRPARLLPTPMSCDGEDEVRLLPTPQAADGTGGRQEKTAMRAGGRRPSGQKATLTLGTAVELRGELTGRPFAAGSESSDEPRPRQLTIEDA
jgi:hypothetical protein